MLWRAFRVVYTKYGPDFDGNFSLNVKPGAKLKISYIGFVSQTVVAKNGMQVVLKEEIGRAHV